MCYKQRPNNRAVHPYMELIPVQLQRDSKKHKASDRQEQVIHDLQPSTPCMLKSAPFSSFSDACAKLPSNIHAVLYAAQIASTMHLQLQQQSVAWVAIEVVLQ